MLGRDAQAEAGQLRASLPEESIRDGQGRVFLTPEREPGCRAGPAVVGGHPCSADQVSMAPGAGVLLEHREDAGVEGGGGRRGGGWSPPQTAG
jgi:hypothetical protein